jgi:uncharacterized membrane protein
MSPEVILHASAGAAGVLTGIVALTARKGEHVHRTAGTVFFAALLMTTASGVYLGFARDMASNAIAGFVVLYMLADGVGGRPAQGRRERLV